MRMRTPTAILIAASLLTVCLLSIACRADQVPPPVMDELVVTGERTGPGMWRVHRGAAQVWILGSMSPLPKGITWRSKQVERVLDGANQVLVQKPFDIGIARILWLLITERSVLMVTGGKRLKDVLPADLHARFAVQRAKYTGDPNKWERFRPLIAAAFLQQAAFHQVGLSTRLDLGAAMRTLAKKHRVRIEEIKIAGVSDVMEALKTLPPATENACVAASLVTAESDLPRLVDRAQAWASGNVERIEKLREPAEVDACRAALDAGVGAAELIARMRRTWLSAIETRLQNGTAFAAGTVDIISFATLGGVFASAMTGNFALLAYYVAQSDSQSAMGSVVALIGFAIGCAVGVLLRRGRAQEQALRILLVSETGLLLFFALYSMWTPHTAHAPSDHLQILLLAVAMGLQAVIGQTISLTTIVFTTTLTKLVGTIADSIANGDVSGLKDVKIQSAIVVSYLFGALLSGALIVHKVEEVVLLPFAGVALAFAMHRRSGLKAV